MGRLFVELNADHAVNVDKITHLFFRPDGGVDVFVEGREKAIGTAKGNQAKFLKEQLAIASAR